MNELSTPILKKPMDKMALANDAAMLRAMVAQTNAAIKAEVEKSLPPGAKINLGENDTTPVIPKPPAEVVDRRGASVMTTDPVFEGEPAKLSPAPTPVPKIVVPPSRASVRRIMFTGKPKTGKSYLGYQLGAVVVDLNEIVASVTTANLFPTELAQKHPQAFQAMCARMRVWGTGTVDERHPIDITRLLLMRSISIPFFGTAEFWARYALSITQDEKPDTRICITGIETEAEYLFFVKEGYRPYHVMASNLTIAARGGSPVAPAIDVTLDNDVMRNTAAKPHGGKLWCVWNDENYPPTSPRLLSVQEFLDSVA